MDACIGRNHALTHDGCQAFAHDDACNAAWMLRPNADTVAAHQLRRLVEHLSNERRMSFAAIGRKTGYGGEFIGRLAAGKNGPSSDTIERFSKAFGVDLAWFAEDLEIGESGDKPSPQIIAYLAELDADGSPAHPDDARELLGVRISSGAHLLSRGAIRMLHDEASARRRTIKSEPLAKGKAALEGFEIGEDAKRPTVARKAR
jgi:transcriptional regulator with XRE-family HTH domain